MSIIWNCPKCDTFNKSSYVKTTRLYCTSCGKFFEWDLMLKVQGLVTGTQVNRSTRERWMMAMPLWEWFGDIPVTQGDLLDEPFLHFPIGAHRLDVWRWFEESFDLSTEMFRY